MTKITRLICVLLSLHNFNKLYNYNKYYIWYANISASGFSGKNLNKIYLTKISKFSRIKMMICFPYWNAFKLCVCRKWRRSLRNLFILTLSYFFWWKLLINFMRVLSQKNKIRSGRLNFCVLDFRRKFQKIFHSFKNFKIDNSNLER